MDSYPRHSPDGLGADDIERLLTEAQALWPGLPRPTSALLDGSAARRAARRRERRAFAAVVRALPVRGRLALGSEEAA